jgi:hypothetical protein
MSQKERDAFVAGAWWHLMVCPGALTHEKAHDEALRRYPDETPAPAGTRDIPPDRTIEGIRYDELVYDAQLRKVIREEFRLTNGDFDSLCARIANPPPEKPTQEPMRWLCSMICCGHSDGCMIFDTWKEADDFREAWTSGVAVAPHGYSAEPHESGHKRAVIVSEWHGEGKSGIWSKTARWADEGMGKVIPTPPEAARRWRYGT